MRSHATTVANTAWQIGLGLRLSASNCGSKMLMGCVGPWMGHRYLAEFHKDGKDTDEITCPAGEFDAAFEDG